MAVTLSLSAQVVEAEPSIIGWLAAALPALGFLAMVKMALGRADSDPANSASTSDPRAKIGLDWTRTNDPSSRTRVVQSRTGPGRAGT